MPKITMQKGERLIAIVHGHPELYDPTQKGYSDFGVKARLWSEVASKCGIKSGNEAKMTWKNLRDCYRICRNKLHYNPNTRKWKFYKHMDFLAPYIKDRKFERSAPVIMDNADVESRESAGLEDSIDIDETQGEFTTIQYWNDSDSKLETTETEPEIADVQNKTVDPPPEVEVRQESPIESDQESFEDVLPEVLNNGPVNNSVKMFFDAMYASTSQLPQSLQRIVKSKVFAAVLDAEEEAEKIKMKASSSISVRVKTET